MLALRIPTDDELVTPLVLPSQGEADFVAAHETEMVCHIKRINLKYWIYEMSSLILHSFSNIVPNCIQFFDIDR